MGLFSNILNLDFSDLECLKVYHKYMLEFTKTVTFLTSVIISYENVFGIAESYILDLGCKYKVRRYRCMVII